MVRAGSMKPSGTWKRRSWQCNFSNKSSEVVPLSSLGMHFCCEEGGSGLQLTKSGVSGGGRSQTDKTDRDKIRAGGEWRYETRKVVRGRA